MAVVATLMALVFVGLPVLEGVPGVSRLLTGGDVAGAEEPIRTISTVAGNGTNSYSGDGGNAPDAALNGPDGVAVDSAGDIYVSDTFNERVRKVDPNGVITTVAGTGSYGFSGDGGPATSAKLASTGGVAVDSAGNLYIADSYNYRVRRVDTAGIITTVAGNGSFGYSGDGGPATSARLTRPDGIALDAAGDLFIVDGGNHRVRKVDTAGVITTIAGTGAAGYSGDGGPATSAQLQWPSGVAVDSAGNVYIADTNNHRVRKVSTAGTITTVAGDGTGAYSGDGGPAASAELYWPFHVAVDSAGNLYIADYGNERVRRVDPTGTIITVAGNGTAGYSGDGGSATSAELDEPKGIAVGSAGNLYISDSNNNRVRRVHWTDPPDGGPFVPPESYGANPAEPQCPICQEIAVNPVSGGFHQSDTDLAIPGRGEALDLTRSYNSLAASAAVASGPLGWGWAASYDMSLSVDPGTGTVTITQETGAQVTFTPASGGGYHAPPRVRATLSHDTDGTWKFTRQSRDQYRFSAAGRLITETDLNGYTTSLTYNTAGELTSVTDPAGRSLTFASDAAGHRTSVTDPVGRRVTYTYDSADNLTNVTDVGGGTTAFSYDSAHRIVSVRDANLGLTTIAYDNTGRVSKWVDAMGRTMTYVYAGNNFGANGTTTITDPNANRTVDTFQWGELLSTARGSATATLATTQYVYDSATTGVTVETDPNGHRTRSTYDAEGNLLTRADGLGRTTTFTYDALNDQTSVTDPAGVTTTMTYDSAGNLLSRSTPLVGSSPAVSETTTYAYSDSGHAGDVTSMTDPRGKVWTYTYNADGDRISEADPLGSTTRSCYDAIGRKTKSIAPTGSAAGITCTTISPSYTTAFTYNEFGDVLSTTDPLGHVITKTYDANRNLLTVTDPKGNVTRNTYDPDDELTAVTRPDGTTLSYGYDANGNLNSQRDGAGNETTYAYDALSRRVSTTDPLRRTTTYGYDPAGNRTSITDPAGQITTLAYDAADRQTGIVYSDAVTANVTYAYDLDGRRTSMIDGTGTTTSTWDSLGRLTGQTNGIGATTTYGYDLAGNITSIAYPGAVGTVTRTYDDAGHLASVGDWLGNTTTFSWDPDGNPTSTTRPNATTTSQTFNAADQLVTITDKKTTPVTTTFASFTYTRDADGLLTSATPTGVGTPENYTYTALNQVSTVNSSAYAYDPADNAVLVKTSTAQTFDSADQLLRAGSIAVGGTSPVGVTTYTFDSRGNRARATPASGTATTYTWDQANRLAGVGGPATASYAYNGDGLRMSKTIAGMTTTFAWDNAGVLPLLLQQVTNSTATNFVYGPGGDVLEQITGGAATWLHHDAQGSTRLLTDSTGSVVGTASYDAWGNPTTATGIGTPLGWDGEYRDAETGLVYLRARYYDSASGVFLSLDPIIDQTHEPYAYADNDPLNSSDPTGLCKTHHKGLWGQVRTARCHATHRVRDAEVTASIAGGLGEWATTGAISQALQHIGASATICHWGCLSVETSNGRVCLSKGHGVAAGASVSVSGYTRSTDRWSKRSQIVGVGPYGGSYDHHKLYNFSAGGGPGFLVGSARMHEVGCI